ncbi:MAG: 4-(cytidine 5'-diphospho)-2-C-methyl-D-erythritol kinase [Vulcanimicrobiaceae bacterium]|jgi:4-diphosphocytidyl-2-C-methyl-D-erythritol kinase
MLQPGAAQAPAKINLTLEILARREDGYHGVRSVMLPIGLRDTVRWQPSERFAFHCNDGAPRDKSNLVMRAFDALDIEPALDITLEKKIPTGGGLGGGSSDGAAILRAAAAGAFGELGDKDFLSIARGLGSDVPFFLVETGALVEGTGERVTALGALPDWWTVIVMPAVAVETAGAYNALDSARGKKYKVRPRNESPSILAVEAVQRGDFNAAIAASMNDFEEVIAASEPAIAASLDALRGAGARLARLCGSGSSCFALAETKDEARAIAESLSPIGARVHVTPLAPTKVWR